MRYRQRERQVDREWETEEDTRGHVSSHFPSPGVSQMVRDTISVQSFKILTCRHRWQVTSKSSILVRKPDERPLSKRKISRLVSNNGPRSQQGSQFSLSL